MRLTLYGHPFSSYTQKVLIALDEHGIAFTFRRIGMDDGAAEELAALWPLAKFPVLVDAGRTILESTTIIEHLDRDRPDAARLIPADPDSALAARMLDRIFDSYVMTPIQTIVLDRLRPEPDRDPYGVAQARAALDRIYAWLDTTLSGRTWATGDRFTLAGCAAAPALFYADWAQPIDPSLATLRAYRARLLARPSFARAVDAARPFRPYFPLGAPDRD